MIKFFILLLSVPCLLSSSSPEELDLEAREHFVNAGIAMATAVAASACAGISAACGHPAVAVVEGVAACEGFLRFGDEYSKGRECERQVERGRTYDSNASGDVAINPEAYDNDRR